MKYLALAVLFAGFATCASATTIWDVNASFTYNSLNNTATGTFVLDPSLNLVNWDITVSGTNTPADVEYTPGDSFRTLPADSTHLDLYDPHTGQYIDLYFASALSESGGTINLLQGDKGADSNSTIVCAGCGILDTTEANTVTGVYVPEPSSLFLLGSGLVGLAGSIRRRFCK